MDDGGQDQPSKPRAFFRAAQFASLGLEMGLSVAIGAGIGYWLDTRFGTKPWLLLFFLLCGIAAGFKAVIDAAKRASTNEKDESGEKPASNETSETKTPTDDGAERTQKD